MCYSVFIYSMRIELSTHSIATPVSANTANHMDAIPNRPRIITRDLDRECKHDVLFGDDIRLAGDLDRDRDGSQVGLR